MSLVHAIFDQVKFDAIDIDIHKNAYEAVTQIAQVMDKLAPQCEEKTLALHSLHSALIYFGNALIKQEKYKIHTNP